MRISVDVPSHLKSKSKKAILQHAAELTTKSVGAPKPNRFYANKSYDWTIAVAVARFTTRVTRKY